MRLGRFSSFACALIGRARLGSRSSQWQPRSLSFAALPCLLVCRLAFSPAGRARLGP